MNGVQEDTLIKDEIEKLLEVRMEEDNAKKEGSSSFKR